MYTRPHRRKTLWDLIIFALCATLVLTLLPAQVASAAPLARHSEGVSHQAQTAQQIQTRRQPPAVAAAVRTPAEAAEAAAPASVSANNVPSPATLRAIQARWPSIAVLQKPLNRAERNALYPPAVPDGPNPMAWAGRNRLQPSSKAMVGLAAVQAAAQPLDAGWHLISIPEEQTDTDPATVLASLDGNYSRALAYDACDVADPWKLHDPNDPGASDLAAIDHRMGLWVEMTGPDTLETTGSVPASTTISLCAGWNLIGYPLAQALPVQGALHSIAGQVQRVFAWELANADDPWDVHDPAVPDWTNDLPAMMPGRGYWVLVSQPVTLEITEPEAPPAVALTAPAEGTEITHPISVTGIITSATVADWTLAYRVEGESDWTPFASGDTSSSNQVAATFDPTLLRNDLYEIQLTASDAFAQSASTQVDVIVEGDLKVGLFTISFVDLTVPLAGIPIQLIRTYDSRDKRTGEFGVGWTLDVRRGTVRHNRAPGEAWLIRSSDGPFGLPCAVSEELGFHATEIRFSDAEVYRFKLNPINFAPASGTCVGQVEYVQTGGVPGATLEILGNIDVRYDNGAGRLLELETEQVYVPGQFRLTTLDGREFLLTLANGLTQVRDANGNTLVFSDDGIVHSSGTGVTFTRDEAGRIIQIGDPNGNTITYSYDAAGDLVAHIDPEGSTTQFTYDPGHYLRDILDPRGTLANRIEYDADGRMIAVEDGASARTEFTHDLAANVEVVLDSRGNTATYTYDDRGNVTRVEQTVTVEDASVPVVTTYAYDDRDNLTTVIDADGVRHEAEYDANDLPTQVTVDPDGAALATAFVYNSAGEVLTQTNPAGDVVHFTYDAVGNLSSVVDPLGNAIGVERNGQGRITRATDALGNETTSTYDVRGFPTGEVVRNADGEVLRSRTFTVDGNGNRLTETLIRVVDGVTRTLTTRYTYDGRNRLTSITDPLDQVTQIEYNEIGRVAARIDAKGRRTEYAYDGLGRRIRTDFPDGTFETVAYDAAGNVAATTDRGGRTTTYSYDELNRLVQTTLPDGAVRRTVYSPAGQVVAEIDARGNRTEYEYDTTGRLTQTTLPQIFDVVQGTTVTPVVQQEYDAAGNRTALVEADGTRTELVYDAARQITQIRYHDGSSQSRQYDDRGRVVQVTDEEGRTTHLGYDALDRLVEVKLPAPAPGAPNPITRYTYDSAGNKLTQTDALGRTTSFRYDELNRLVERTLPGGQSETFTYDEVGNLIAHTDFNGQTIVYTYDAMDRLARKNLPAGPPVDYTYTPSGRRASVVDSRGATLYAYDQLDRLTTVTHPDAAVVSYAYDAGGNLSSITSPSGSVTYDYNALNSLTQVSEPGSTVTYGYDRAGNLRRTTAGDGTVSEYTYDARHRLTSIVHSAMDGTALASFTYVLSPTGRRESVAELDGSLVSYTYDGLDRLTGETRTGAQPYAINYEYDAVGNRTHMVDGGVETIYAYDANDRLLSAGSLSFAYDANGNTLSMGDGVTTLTYGWDAENRLASVSDGATTTTYTYDADGNRVAQSSAGEEIAYLVDTLNGTGYAQVLEERDSAGNLMARHTYGADLLSTTRENTTRFVHHDGQMSVRLLTEAGSISDDYTYDAFGNLLTSTGSSANSHRYTGEQFDAAADAYYLRARWYTPALGRFLSQDSFAGFESDPLSLHKYLYAHATPANAIDPSGHFSLIGLSISTAISRGLQAWSASRLVRSVCLVKEIASNMSTLLSIAKVLRGLRVLTNLSFDLTQYGASGNMDGQQVLLPGSTINIEVEHPLANFPQTARFLNEDTIKKVQFNHYLKRVQTSAGDMTPWMDIKVESFQDKSLGSSFPWSDVTVDEFAEHAEFSAGAVLFSKDISTCGFSIGEFNAEFETKYNSYNEEGSAAVVGSIQVLRFLETKATLLELK